MTRSQTKSFIINNEKMLLDINDGVFIPTATTENLINSVKGFIKKPGITLDLGSGSGIVGISLFADGLIESKLHASDLSQNAVECIKKNCNRHGIPVDARQGSLFEPWQAYKFDYIVDDISGVSEKIAKVSPWFRNIPCISGNDGIDLTVQVLSQSKKYLNKNGYLFFPVISLSNTYSVMKTARNIFNNVELLKREEWPLPEDMYQHIDLLKGLKDDNRIQYEEKFGIIICHTDIYVAYD